MTGAGLSTSGAGLSVNSDLEIDPFFFQGGVDAFRGRDFDFSFGGDLGVGDTVAATSCSEPNRSEAPDRLEIACSSASNSASSAAPPRSP